MTSISILLASRKRPDSLLKAIASLTDTASHPESLEVIAAVDPDDSETIALRQTGALPACARLWIAPERFGYARLNEYLNGLAPQASGDWLVWFNDDMRMLTPGWDDIITSHRPAVIWPQANHAGHANIIPVWPRAWSMATGHGSPNSHSDTYWQYVGEALNRHDRVSIKILHDRADITGGHDDETYAEGRKLIGSDGMVPGFSVSELNRHVATDTACILKLLEQLERSGQLAQQ